MERAAKGLWGVLRRVARPERPLDLLAAVWPLMVGQRLAAHTQPVAWEKGSVVVAVGDREWQKQLEGMADEVRKQINRWWGSELVREVKFSRGKVPGASAPPTAQAPRHPAQLQGKTEAEEKLKAALKELEGPLARISDVELRDLIARVAAKYLAKQEKK